MASERVFFRRRIRLLVITTTKSKGATFEPHVECFMFIYDVRRNVTWCRIYKNHLPWWFGPSGQGMKYPRLRFWNHVSNLGHRRTQEISILRNFPNSQLYQKLNVRECWRINYLVFMSRFYVLGCPRLSIVVFVSIFFRFE